MEKIDYFAEITLVWRAVLSATGAAVQFVNSYLDSGELKTKTIMLGIRHEMEYSGSDYFIHAIFAFDTKNPYYIRVSPG